MKILSHEDIEQINTMKNYLDSLPATVNSKKAYCFLIIREEINALLNQKNNGNSLDGLRVYFGANIIDGYAIPNIHVVACEKDAHNDFNDFVPKSNSSLNKYSKENSFPLVAKGKPCPTECGMSNLFKL